MNLGSVRSVRDLVVSVQFDQDGPDIGELLLVHNPAKTVLLVNRLDPSNIAVCLNVLGDRSIQKNMEAERTKRGIDIPVGKPTIGRVLDALGRPLDGLPAATGPDVKYKNILQPPAPRT